jgi:hypothetical protein
LKERTREEKKEYKEYEEFKEYKEEEPGGAGSRRGSEQGYPPVHRC